MREHRHDVAAVKMMAPLVRRKASMILASAILAVHPGSLQSKAVLVGLQQTLKYGGDPRTDGLAVWGSSSPRLDRC